MAELGLRAAGLDAIMPIEYELEKALEHLHKA